MDMAPQAWPEWYDGRHINEVLFCQQFLGKHPMKCVRGRLFTVDGLIEDEGQIGNLILEEISGVLTANLSKTVANLLASIKLQAYSPPLPIETDRIHVANGTYFMDGSFTADKSYCNNRLTVSYNPNAPVPKRWLQFLSELLQPEDIPTLQEFLGYCLLPTTKGQKMLMLTLSVMLSKLFNGTLLAQHDADGKIIKDTVLKFDFRGELGATVELGKQAVPVLCLDD